MRRIGTCEGLSDEALLKVDMMNQAIVAARLDGAHVEALADDAAFDALVFAEHGTLREEKGLVLAMDPTKTLPRAWTIDRTFEDLPIRGLPQRLPVGARASAGRAEVVDSDLVCAFELIGNGGSK